MTLLLLAKERIRVLLDVLNWSLEIEISTPKVLPMGPSYFRGQSWDRVASMNIVKHQPLAHIESRMKLPVRTN